MKISLLMNAMWYEEIMPFEAAKALNISEKDFFKKISGEECFTKEEQDKLCEILCMGASEREAVFGEGN